MCTLFGRLLIILLCVKARVELAPLYVIIIVLIRQCSYVVFKERNKNHEDSSKALHLNVQSSGVLHIISFRVRVIK